MFNKFAVTLGLAVGLCAINTSKASALNFSFSFSNNAGNTNGTVTGTIFGLTDNATSAATQIIIDSFPAALGTPVDGLIATNWNVLGNSFTVANGALTGGNFSAQASASGICLNAPCFGPFNNGLTFNQAGNTVGNNGGFAALNPAGLNPPTPIPWHFSPEQSLALGIPLFIGLRELKKRKIVAKARVVEMTR
ncbi:hypothetical protein [Nodularia chucula]|uniref:hypothetical protein n=1 Tax=Nodularia chucula TaxID=3093667 RepID=UPI0039C6B128